MALDLLWRKVTSRNFGRGASLTVVALPPVPPTTTTIEDALRRVSVPYPGILVERRGRGAIVSKRWRW